MRKNHPAAVALREAAVAFTAASREPVRDPRDRAFLRADRALQRAALRFAASLEDGPEVLTLPGGQQVVPYTVKCYRPGCSRRKHGYLTIYRGGGAFYNRRGKLLADLREQDFACPEHGVVDGSAPFLYRDTE
jgi:hypothetical protein